MIMFNQKQEHSTQLAMFLNGNTEFDCNHVINLYFVKIKYKEAATEAYKNAVKIKSIMVDYLKFPPHPYLFC